MKQWEHRREHKEQNRMGVQTENPGDADKPTTEGKTQASIHRSDQEKQTVTGS